MLFFSGYFYSYTTGNAFTKNVKYSRNPDLEFTNELKAKKELVKEDAKIKYEERLKDLEVKKAELEIKYTELKNASEEKWKEAKDAFSSASNSFKEGFAEIRSLFS